MPASQAVMVLCAARCQAMFMERPVTGVGNLIVLLNLTLCVSKSGPGGQEGREDSVEPLATFCPGKEGQASEG